MIALNAADIKAAACFGNELQRVADHFRQWIFDTAETAIPKELHELSEDEKFAIAVLCGVPLDSRLPTRIENGVLVLDTSLKFQRRTVPCALTKIDGKWKAVIRAEDATRS